MFKVEAIVLRAPNWIELAKHGPVSPSARRAVSYIVPACSSQKTEMSRSGLCRDKAILSYLQEHSHDVAAESLQTATGLRPESKHSGLLVKRWKAVIGLQKRVNCVTY